ncbi:hypothetical protein, partial [Rhizobium sp.]|uniref:hypothetical protein n=1 Tax=Rhizobium sp. TaxID=391 RepID=UPI0028AC3FE0
HTRMMEIMMHIGVIGKPGPGWHQGPRALWNFEKLLAGIVRLPQGSLTDQTGCDLSRESA